MKSTFSSQDKKKQNSKKANCNRFHMTFLAKIILLFAKSQQGYFQSCMLC